MSARTHDPETVVIVLQGDVDLHVSAVVHDAVEAAVSSPAAHVIVDLTRATLFDSSAIHAVLAARGSRDGHAPRVAIVCANPSILQVLEIAGIAPVVPVYGTIPEATDGLPPAA